MEVIQEIYTQYEVCCIPLSKTRYTFSEIRHVKLSDAGESTSALLKLVREKEKRELEKSGLLTPREPSRALRDEAHDEYTSSLSTTSESYAAFSMIEELKQDSIPQIPPDELAAETARPAYEPRLKRIRSKVQNALFDYSEIEQEKIEQEVDELVNADGYYNEVEPIDIDVDYKKERRLNAPAIIAIIGLIVYIIVILNV